MNKQLRQKTLESLSAVMPITFIVILLCITITPMPLAPLMLFLVGAVLLILGMGFFTLGVDMAMLPIGEQVGTQLAKSGRLVFIIPACFLIGAFVTMAEPDLQVLAGQTPGVPDMLLILSVAAGVGIFLIVAFLRSLFGWSLSRILLIFYAIVFILAIFVPKDFLSVAFDSGGVTTGPITVPFILTLGVGLSSIGQSKNSESGSFGMVALCSIGPILATMILGLAFGSSSGTYEPLEIPNIQTTAELSQIFGREFPEYAREVAFALMPILLFFLFFQIFFLKLRRKKSNQDTGGHALFLHRADTLSHRRQRGFHAGRKLSGTAAGLSSLEVDSGACRHGHRLFYCPGGARCRSAESAGRRRNRRLHLPHHYDEGLIHRHGRICGFVHVPFGFGPSASAFPCSGIRNSPGTHLCCAPYLYFHCI